MANQSMGAALTLQNNSINNLLNERSNFFGNDAALAAQQADLQAQMQLGAEGLQASLYAPQVQYALGSTQNANQLYLGNGQLQNQSFGLGLQQAQMENGILGGGLMGLGAGLGII